MTGQARIKADFSSQRRFRSVPPPGRLLSGAATGRLRSSTTTGEPRLRRTSMLLRAAPLGCGVIRTCASGRTSFRGEMKILGRRAGDHARNRSAAAPASSARHQRAAPACGSCRVLKRDQSSRARSSPRSASSLRRARQISRRVAYVRPRCGAAALGDSSFMSVISERVGTRRRWHSRDAGRKFSGAPSNRGP